VSRSIFTAFDEQLCENLIELHMAWQGYASITCIHVYIAAPTQIEENGSVFRVHFL